MASYYAPEQVTRAQQQQILNVHSLQVLNVQFQEVQLSHSPPPMHRQYLRHRRCVIHPTTNYGVDTFVLAQLRQRLNVDEIDSIKDDVQDALRDEKLQLLEDIEFIQV